MDKDININIDDKYFCYFLGIMWADGYIYSKGRTKNRIDITLVYDDLKDIEYIFDKIGYWKKYTRNRIGYKLQLNFRAIDNTLYNFLKEHDYDKKSKISPNKILRKISEKNIKYFLKGFFDGDGCFYYNKYTRQCVFTSSYDQNWMFLTKILNTLCVKNTSIKQISKSGCRSFLRITNRDIIKFGNYLYDDVDIIGLKRKYEKFLLIKESYLKKTIKIGNNKKSISIGGRIFKSISEASKLTNINRECIRYRLSSNNYIDYIFI